MERTAPRFTISELPSALSGRTLMKLEVVDTVRHREHIPLGMASVVLSTLIKDDKPGYCYAWLIRI